MLYVDGIDKSVLPTDQDLLDVCIPEIEELLKMEISHKNLPDVDHEHGTFLVRKHALLPFPLLRQPLLMRLIPLVFAVFTLKWEYW